MINKIYWKLFLDNFTPTNFQKSVMNNEADDIVVALISAIVRRINAYKKTFDPILSTLFMTICTDIIYRILTNPAKDQQRKMSFELLELFRGYFEHKTNQSDFLKNLNLLDVQLVSLRTN
jgi:hypothetical protein